MAKALIPITHANMKRPQAVIVVRDLKIGGIFFSLWLYSNDSIITPFVKQNYQPSLTVSVHKNYNGYYIK